MNANKLFHTAGRYWFFILLGIVVFYSLFSDGNSNSSTSLPSPSSTQTISQPSGSNAVSTPGVSLATGTWVGGTGAYLNGNGKLLIRNGTSLDSVAKLVRGGRSVQSVYIKANSNYTIENVSDGIYKLVFALGSGWDSASKTFIRNKNFQEFDELFDFTTTEDSEYVYYATYEVTLNPVVGGTADTDNINEQQFNAY